MKQTQTTLLPSHAPNFNIAYVLMIKYRIPGLDIISFNTFGKLKSLNRQLQYYTPLWNGPFLIMECGAYGPPIIFFIGSAVGNALHGILLAGFGNMRAVPGLLEDLFVHVEISTNGGWLQV